MYGRPQGNAQLIFHIAWNQLFTCQGPPCQTFIQLNSAHVLATSPPDNFVMVFQAQYKVNARHGMCAPLPSMQIVLTWCLGLPPGVQCLNSVDSKLTALLQCLYIIDCRASVRLHPGRNH